MNGILFILIVDSIQPRKGASSSRAEVVANEEAFRFVPSQAHTIRLKQSPCFVSGPQHEIPLGLLARHRMLLEKEIILSQTLGSNFFLSSSDHDKAAERIISLFLLLSGIWGQISERKRLRRTGPLSEHFSPAFLCLLGPHKEILKIVDEHLLMNTPQKQRINQCRRRRRHPQGRNLTMFLDCSHDVTT